MVAAMTEPASYRAFDARKRAGWHLGIKNAFARVLARFPRPQKAR